MKSLPRTFKRILMPLLTVILLGQSLLSLAAPCVMMDYSTDDISLEVAEVDHSTHHMDHSVNEPENQDTEPCCDGSGDCSMTNCLTVLALPSSHFTSAIDYFSNPELLPARGTAVHSTDTLFRPPIQG